MNKMLKSAIAALLLMLLPVLALAEAPVLLVELPEDLQMIENVEFEDGDFIQTYQAADGMVVNLLRYSGFDLTAMDIAQSDWAGHHGAAEVALESVAGFPASAVRLSTTDSSDQAIEVLVVVVDCGAQSLILQVVCPHSMDLEAVDAQFEAMLGSLDVLTQGEADETAEVG